MADPVEPETVSKWFPVYRDFAIVTVGLFMLIYETIFAVPNPLIVAAAGAALTLPVGFRIDARRRNGSDDDDHAQRWTGLP